MERIKNLGKYQKAALLLTILMVLVFTVIYAITTSRDGYVYKDEILIPMQENGDIIYSGKIDGEQAIFTVFEDKSVEFQYGDKIYGPYVIKEDPNAITSDNDMGDGTMGIEVYCDGEVIFRGSARKMTDYWRLANEDGTSAAFEIYVTSADGSILDSNGNVIDPMAPDISNILVLVTGAELEHKGYWFIWFLGVVLCMNNVVAILFADELFRIKLAYTVRNVDKVEPSDWEITGRYISWAAYPIIALVVFIVGLGYYG